MVEIIRERMGSAVETETRTQGVQRYGPAFGAYQLLYWGFTLLPIIAGVDKFTHWLVNWDQYLAPNSPGAMLLGTANFMRLVGVIEVVAGFLVAFRPRIGGVVVGVWLLGIIVNLLMIPGYYDIALRDFGLALGAFALARLATEFR